MDGRKRVIEILTTALMLSAIGIPIAQALPGQGTDEVLQWVKTNPGLRPSPGEKLVVRRNNGPVQRLTFEVSMLAPGRIVPIRTSGKVRTETLTIFDMLYGVTEARLEESLRSVYGATVHRDFQTAKVLHTYPTNEAVQKAIKANQPIAAALKGELRKGQTFAYWVEVTRNPDGLNYGGKVIVFLPEDLPKIESEIKAR
jgi:hypothetical protein